ncbi:MAG TPA: zinc-binding dehydrogenase, partial [Thermoanaerobaculia bacterium]|nr:zinc-binding dehydrogenase [Thermoanaerobaculia bacterium]
DSWALTAGAPTARVFSHLAPHHRDSYGPEVLADGKGQTAWVVARGPGEWFELVFEPSGFHPDVPENNTRTGVDRLYLWNGYNKSPERWQEHARVHHLRLDVDDRPVAVLTLLDEQRPQSQNLVPCMTKRSQEDLNILRELLETGKITPVIDRRYSLSEVPRAIQYLEEGHARGKVVITPGS